MNLKKFGIFILYLLPWFISALLFRSNPNYYNTLTKPFFAPPSWLFAIIWPILYLLITYSIFNIYNISDKKYKNILLINYISNQLFSFFFFTIKNNLLSLIDTVIVLVSSIYLYKITNQTEKKYSKYLIPYIIWNIFSTILILFVFAMN